MLELANVSKRFGNVVALEDVSLNVPAGTVTCLLGDNGAGKSTVIRVLAGVYQPDTGSYLIDGDAVRLPSPRAALERGIATVHQDLGLIPLLSIWRNFVLGAEPQTGRGPLRRIDVSGARAATRDALQSLGIILRDPDEPVAMLSGGERQSIAIARAIHRGARTLILDEPTAALGVKQVATVLRTISEARAQGIGVLFVTHNPAHALEVGDLFVMLQQGKVRALLTREQATVDRLTELMSALI